MIEIHLVAIATKYCHHSAPLCTEISSASFSNVNVCVFINLETLYEVCVCLCECNLLLVTSLPVKQPPTIVKQSAKDYIVDPRDNIIIECEAKGNTLPT